MPATAPAPSPTATPTSESLEAMLREVAARAPAVAAYGYVATWALADMLNRARAAPADPRFRDIRFPHTRVPLFSPEEAAQLEVLFGQAAAAGGLPPDAGAAPARGGSRGGKQVGGGGVPLTPAGARRMAEETGAALQAVVGAVSPEAFSPDAAYRTVAAVMDESQAQLAAWSATAGLRFVEDSAPDLRGVLPTPIGVPIPFVVPARAVLPALTAVLEAIRMAAAAVPFVGSLLTVPPTLALFLLDLGRGEVYHAMYTLLALLGAGGLYAGLALKVARNALLLVAPDLRGQLRDVAFASGKSLLVGTLVWLFTTLAPDAVRQPVAALLDAARAQVDAVNASLAGMEAQARAALPPGLADSIDVVLPRLPADAVPSFASLQDLQTVVHDPRVWCQPEVAAWLDELRGVPPMALFLDLLRIPGPADPARAAQCAAVNATPLAALLAPRIVVKA